MTFKWGGEDVRADRNGRLLNAATAPYSPLRVFANGGGHKGSEIPDDLRVTQEEKGRYIQPFPRSFLVSPLGGKECGVPAPVPEGTRLG
jgi:hypothetical protein